MSDKPVTDLIRTIGFCYKVFNPFKENIISVFYDKLSKNGVAYGDTKGWLIFNIAIPMTTSLLRVSLLERGSSVGKYINHEANSLVLFTKTKDIHPIFTNAYEHGDVEFLLNQCELASLSDDNYYFNTYLFIAFKKKNEGIHVLDPYQLILKMVDVNNNVIGVDVQPVVIVDPPEKEQQSTNLEDKSKAELLQIINHYLCYIPHEDCAKFAEHAKLMQSQFINPYKTQETTTISEPMFEEPQYEIRRNRQWAQLYNNNERKMISQKVYNAESLITATSHLQLDKGVKIQENSLDSTVSHLFNTQ